MSDSTLPERPHADHLRRQAKQLLKALRADAPKARARLSAFFSPVPPDLRLHHAQLVLAREYGYPSWRALMAGVQALRAAAQEMVDATQVGDLARISLVLDRHPRLVHTVVDRGAGQLPADSAAMGLLHLCAAENQPEAARLLVSRGADLDRRNADGRTALHDSLEYGRAAMTALLLESGADVDAAGAALLGDLARLAELVDRDPAVLADASTGLSVLGWASYGGHPEVLNLLQRHGVPLDEHDALFPAAECGHHRFLARAIALGADVNRSCGRRRRTALHEAALGRFSADRRPSIRVLLDAGAKANAVDADGHTPLDLAVAAQQARSAEDDNLRDAIALLEAHLRR